MSPFKSKAQRRYLWANDPEIAQEFERKTPESKKKRLPEKKQEGGYIKDPEKKKSKKRANVSNEDILKTGGRFGYYESDIGRPIEHIWRLSSNSKITDAAEGDDLVKFRNYYRAMKLYGKEPEEGYQKFNRSMIGPSVEKTLESKGKNRAWLDLFEPLEGFYMIGKERPGGYPDRKPGYSTGGLVDRMPIVPDEAYGNINLPELNTKDLDLSNSVAGGSGVGLNTGSLISGATNFATGAANSILQTKSDQLSIDSPMDNPAEVLEKKDKLGVAGSIISDTGAGAAAGSAFGTVGTGIGAALGLGKGVVESLIGRKDRIGKRNDAEADWSNKWAKSASKNVSGYSKGGWVRGKGTGKSDDVNMNVEEGSFIVPTEYADQAYELGKRYLNWTDEEIAERFPRTEGGEEDVDIKASNGEVIFTPEEVDTLSYYAIDLDKLAPNADEDIDFKKEMPNPPDEAYGNTNIPRISGKDLNLSGNKEEAGEEEGRSFVDYIPEIASTVQAAGGLAGLISSRERPDMEVSNELRSLASETAREAGYGLPPAVKNKMKQDNDRIRRSVINEIATKGGSPQEVSERLKSITSTMMDKNQQIELSDYQERQRKMDVNRNIRTKIAGQEFDMQKDTLRAWEQNQAAFGELLSAGIGNIIGSRQYKEQLDMLRDTRDNSINITVPK